ncbi:hypothetical protein EDD16DRAFT_1477898, partial [Pisolithus croceorrhizus]
ELACTLGVHRNMLHLYMKQHGIKHHYSALSNMELDQLIMQFKTTHPESSLCYVIGHLQALGHHVQYQHVLHSLHRVDHIGQALRDQQVWKQQKYYVKQPDVVWHIDGHHKLIHQGIIIHGFIDGFFCTICENLLAMVLHTNLLCLC